MSKPDAVATWTASEAQDQWPLKHLAGSTLGGVWDDTPRISARGTLGS